MQSYRSLTAWQRAHRLCIETLRATDKLREPRSFALFDQLRRAAISVVANIVEGYALQTTNLFRRHVRIAIGSAAEVQCLLDVADEMGYLPRAIVTSLRGQVHDTLGLLFGLLRSNRIGS